MTNREKTHLHNIFIKLKNEGKSIKKIRKEALIDEPTLNEWNEAYKATLKKYRGKTFKLIIFGIDQQQEYVTYRYFSFKAAVLEELLSSRSPSAGIQSQYRVELSNKYSTILEKYVGNFKWLTADGRNISVSYNLKKEYLHHPTANRLAQEAIRFFAAYYFNYIQNKYTNKTTPDTYRSAKAILPYAIKALEIKNYEGIEALKIEPIPIDANWVFLIGENDYNKTSVLKAIAIGLIGISDNDTELFEPGTAPVVSLEYHNNNESIIHNTNSLYESTAPLACYGASRLQPQSDQTQNQIERKSATTYSLFNTDGILLNIEIEMLFWHITERERSDKVKQAILRVVPSLYDLTIDTENRRVLYTEKTTSENDTPSGKIPLEKLARSIQSIILMVGDMLIRLFRSQPEIIDPTELAGIVIIDELNFHWHPKIQRDTPRLLAGVFPRIQFIVSTNSPILLLEAPQNALFLKINSPAENKVMIEEIKLTRRPLSADQILKRIFEL